MTTPLENDATTSNSRIDLESSQTQFKQTNWRDVRIGQIIKIRENEYFPCDMLLLNTSLPKGICYVETKNLDGETNLKHKQAEKKILQLSKNREEILANFLNASIECEQPNASIYTYQGVLRI